jgi:hypothetical protein
MDGIKPPQLPEQPVEVVRPEHLARLLKTCEGRDFASHRDTASASSGCWATVDDLGRCRSAAGPPRHSTGTYGLEKSTGWPTCRSSGLAATGP